MKPPKIQSPNVNPYALVVNLDDSHRLELLKRALEISRAKPAHFARLMGASPASLSGWLAGTQRVSGLAVRAAVCAAMLCGVPVVFPKPGIQFEKFAKPRRKG